MNIARKMRNVSTPQIRSDAIALMIRRWRGEMERIKLMTAKINTAIGVKAAIAVNSIIITQCATLFLACEESASLKPSVKA
jgi:hypothetical protein